MPGKEKNTAPENKKHSLSTVLRVKFGSKSKNETTVDEKFLSDLSDISTIGRYQIREKIGQGSMGLVYLGRDPYIKRNVAIKVSRPAPDVVGEQADKYRERFFLEAQSAGKLVHPHIVSIYDCGMYKDFCYMTMEYMDGPTLKKFCKRKYLMPVPSVVQSVFSVCKALHYAHEREIIHRDIKPSNIMINSEGYVKVADFGIAQVKSEQTVSKGILGSPRYMSPEQIKEKPLDNTTDIFSLGCVLYELLTGVRAFDGENDFTVMYNISTNDPVPIREINPELPEILETITKKALAKDPGERYQTCGDFAYDLRVALRGLDETIKTGRSEDIVDYVHNISFFENFSKNQIREILQAGNIIKKKKRDVIVTQGDIDDSFYIILSGRAVVQKDDQKIASIKQGECFGEMAYLCGHTRAATVLAETDCALLKISATLLDRSAESLQLLFTKNFARTLIQRLSKTC